MKIKSLEARAAVAVIAVLVVALGMIIWAGSYAGDDLKGIVTMETTMGTMKFQLEMEKAPLTSQNFINLTKSGFYNGLTFHRVIEGFMIQGGDPLGNGRGGPGYTIKDEFNSDLRHDGIGVLSMANKGLPDTGGSQFFITLAEAPWLDGRHAVFGRLIGGQDVLEKIGSVETDSNDMPLEDVVIEQVRLE